MKLAVVYEKVETPNNNDTYILKPVEGIIGECDEKGVFHTGEYDEKGDFHADEEEKFYSYNDAKDLKKEENYLFYGNPIDVTQFAKQNNFNYGTPDYNFSLQQYYYEKYYNNLLSASISDDKVSISHIDLGKISDCVIKEGAAKFVEENKYIAIKYKKELASDVDDSYLIKPVGVIFGDCDEKSNLFKEYDTEIVYDAYDSKEALKSDSEYFFQSACLIEDLVELDGITKDDLEDLSKKYFENFRSTYSICKCGKLFTKASFNMASFEKDYVKEELTEDDMEVRKVVESGLKLLKKELNDDDKQKLFNLYKVLIRFCLVEGKINGITKNDVAYQTYKGCFSAFADIEQAIISLGIREELSAMKSNQISVTNPNNKEVAVAESNKDKDEKTYVNDLGKLKFPEQSWDDIYDGITKVVIGQEEHVRTITSILYKRMVELNLDEKIPSRFGLLITGAPGSGKTEILKTFTSIVDAPIIEMDSTQLTAAGYTGEGIPSYLEQLYYEYNCDEDYINDAFAIMDEIDKIKANDGPGADVSGKGAQNTLLKFMDGTNYNLAQQGFDHPHVIINSSRMTPIAAGAFAEMIAEAIKKREGKIGFDKNLKSSQIINANEKNKFSVDDYVKYGMSEQLMRRLFITVHLNELNEQLLLRILKESSKSPLIVQRKIFNGMGVECKFTHEYQKAVAAEAYRRKIGASGLAAVVQDTTCGPVEELSRNRGKYKKLVFTKECIKDPSKYKLFE